MTLNQRFCESAKSKGAAQTDYFDSLTPGLVFRASSSGRRTWAFKFTHPVDNKRVLMTLGTFPAICIKEAREAAEVARAKVQDGNDPRVLEPLPAVAKTIADLIDNRIALEVRHSAKQYLRSCKEIERRYDTYVIPVIGHVSAKDFGMKHLSDCMRPLFDRGVYGQAHSVFFDLQALMRFAVAQGDLKFNPIAGAVAPKQSSAASAGEEDEQRVLTPEEVRIVWHHLPEALKGSKNVPIIVRLMLATGQRVGEVSGIRKSELDLTGNRPFWTIPADRVKNKKGKHVVPLNALALEIIRNQFRAINGDVLFPNKFGEPMRVAKICNALDQMQAPREGMPLGKLGIPVWTSHDLRRTVSDLPSRIENNMPLADRYMDHVLNHRGSTRNTVRQKHYNPHSFFDEKAAALDEWGRFLAELVADSALELVSMAAE
ncbi:MAG TPA: integrase arm-type DNA-binding domain-containing protein [Rhizomicrobium sp.]|nr:integrase arm-type DNA-binding domain-containing protein [Rhizomicrobium sp.]